MITGENSYLYISNSINWSNNTNFEVSSSIYVSNSIYESVNLPSSVINIGGNIIDANPAFLTSGDHPYQLTESSPAINSGYINSDLEYETDLMDNPRISKGRVDIGAYEYQQTGDWLWVTSPIGGEFMESGSTFPITWIRSNSSFSVSIELFDGMNWSTIENTALNTGEYSNWIVPEIDSDSCLIKITDYSNGAISHTSDNMFSIKGNIIEHNEEISGTWSIDNSPYTIIGKAIISSGATLVIEPEVEIKFKTGSINSTSSTYFDKGMLEVNGKLNAVGTSNSPILFTRNGNEGVWGMIYFSSSSNPESSLKYCNIDYADYLYTNDYFFGGASFNSGTATIENCDISNCYLGLDISYNSSPLVRNNIIHNNFDGGVLCWSSSNTKIVNNSLYNNGYISGDVYGGIGIRCYNSSPAITNNTITFATLNRNSNQNNLFKKVDCEKSFNPSSRNLYYGISCESSSNPVIMNSIVYANGPLTGGANFNISSSSPILSYSLIEDEALPAGAVDGGNNIYNQNPIFNDSSNLDFTLQNGSPCINTANPDTIGLNIPEFDVDGNSRIVSGVVDMGAFENQVVMGIDSPENIQITNSVDSITLSWDVVESANSYKVYSSDSPDGTFTQISENQSEFSFNGNQVNWSQSVTVSRKFYYVKASTEDYPIRENSYQKSKQRNVRSK